MSSSSHQTAANRLPFTVAGAFVEWAGLRHTERAPRVLERIAALEAMLDAEPAASAEDLRARLTWFGQVEATASEIAVEKYAQRLRRLLDDVDEIARAAR